MNLQLFQQHLLKRLSFLHWNALVQLLIQLRILFLSNLTLKFDHQFQRWWLKISVWVMEADPSYTACNADRLQHLSKISWLYSHRCNSRISSLFYWSICLCFCQHHIVLVLYLCSKSWSQVTSVFNCVLLFHYYVAYLGSYVSPQKF